MIRTTSAVRSSAAFLGIAVVAVELVLACPAAGQRSSAFSLASAADQLASDAASFVSAVRSELGGTPQGRRLQNLGEGLLGSAEAFRAAARARVPDPNRLRETFEGVERAAASVFQDLNRIPGAAPQAQWVASRIDRGLGMIRPTLHDYIPTNRPVPIPLNLGYDPSRVAEAAGTLTRDLDLTVDRIEREVGRVAPYDRVARELQGLSSQVHDLQHDTFSAPPLPELQEAWQGLRRQARYAGRTLEGAQPPLSVARAWQTARTHFDDLGRTLGVDPTFGPGGGPDPVRPPVRPPVIDPTPSDQLVSLADQAIGELDAFLLALQPQLLNVPEGLQFQADARAVRAEILGLRQALYTSPDAASRSHRQAETAYTRLRNRTERLGQGRSGPMIDRVRAVGDLLAAMRPGLSRF